MPDASGKTIAIVSHAWNDDLTGGAFKVATDFARFLAGQGHEVHYLCGAQHGSGRAEMVDDVTVWRYEYPQASGPRALLAHLSRMGKLFHRVCQDRSFDAVSGHSPLQYFAVARQRRVCPAARFTFTVHSPMVDELQAAGRASWPVRTLGRWIDGRCLHHSDHVTTDSRYTCRRMCELYGDTAAAKMSVQSPWVDVDRFRPVADKHQRRNHLGTPWSAEVPTLLCLRRLERRMGLIQLVQAIKQVTAQGLAVRLLIGGSGSMESDLSEEIRRLELQNTVFMLGRVPDDQLADSYAAADCFVLPTTALECFGLITLESYACGVPVIATPVAAIPEIIQQHDSNWLTSGTTAAEIASKIGRFLRNELVHDPLELRKIAQSYSLQTMAPRLAATVLGQSIAEEDLSANHSAQAIIEANG